MVPTTLHSLNSVLFPALEPLGEDRLLLEEELSEEDNEVGFDIYESPCATYASNEEFSPADIDEFIECDRTFYGGCLFDDPTELETSIEPLYSLEVVFDYELYHRVGAHSDKAMKFLEMVMLDHLAAVIGLKECDTDDGNSSNRRRQLKRYHPFSEAELLRFVAITSEPGDAFDPDFETCGIPVSFAASENTVCEPVTGVVRAILDNDPPMNEGDITAIRSGILKMIRHGMNNDLYVAGNVKQAAFIGKRPEDGNGNANQALSNRRTAPSNDKSGTVVGIICAAVVVILFLALFVAFVLRRKGKQVHESDDITTRPSDDHSPVAATKSPSLTVNSTGERDSSGVMEVKGTPRTSHKHEVELEQPPIQEFTFNIDSSIAMTAEMEQPPIREFTFNDDSSSSEASR